LPGYKPWHGKDSIVAGHRHLPKHPHPGTCPAAGPFGRLRAGQATGYENPSSSGTLPLYTRYAGTAVG